MTKQAGLAPGTLVHIGERPDRHARLTVIDYGPDHVQEREIASVDECFAYRDTNTVTWINVDGVHQTEIIAALGEHFGLHPLLLEDIVNTTQRPKAEDFEGYAYLVLRMLFDPDPTDDELEIDSEQISIVVGPRWVLTFQEEAGDIFQPVRERIRSGRGRIRKSGPDYLAYALADVVVDKYFSVLEGFGNFLEDLEREVMENPRQQTLHEIQNVKRAMIEVRRAVWPLRDALNVLLRGDSRTFKKATLVFLRDVYDHTVRVMDMTETMRELIGGMVDIYMSAVSNRMNEVMKVLTIIATIFIPLTFIAGVYGMNFEHMPELHWEKGYFYVWGVMLLVGVVLLLLFKRKRWL